MDHDVVAFYFCLPFGWSGSPGDFASVACSIPLWRRRHSSVDMGRGASQNCNSFLFSRDGIPVEPPMCNLREQIADCWEEGSRHNFGRNAASEAKLREWGNGERAN